MSAAIKVTVAICTFRRPESLSKLLSDVSGQRFCRIEGVEVSILVVDNDGQRSAWEVVENASATVKYPVRYVHQPMRGLSTVRNTAMECCDDADFIAFVDDDEGVIDTWLDELLFHGNNPTVAFVIGPVRPKFPAACPEYFVRSRLYHRIELSDGARIQSGNTGNSLLRVDWIRAKGLKFRSEFDHSGGEDTCFFGEIVSHGGNGIFAANAIAYEPVARERLSILWLLRRRCRYGATEVSERLMREQRPEWVCCAYALRGIGRIFAACALTTVFCAIDRARALRFACGGARGLGYLFGAFGRKVREYG